MPDIPGRTVELSSPALLQAGPIPRDRAVRWIVLAALFICALVALGSSAHAAEAEAGITDAAMDAAHDRIAQAKSDMAAAMDAGREQIDAAMDAAGIDTDSAAPGLVANTVAPKHGTLFLLKPAPTAPATFTGRGGYSADGTSGPSGQLAAAVPPGSTVEQAYLYAYIQTANPTPAESTVTFDGVPVTAAKLDDYAITLSSTRADVTQQVAAKVGSGSGLTNFSAPTTLPVDGLALAVVYSNPALPERTIAIFDGAAQTLGDTATFTFAAPLDKSDPGFSARMSLGIGFSFQQGSGHICGPGNPVSKQHSVIDVNGMRVTSCAGGDDDAGTAGSLITVGGVGDSTDNPADPFQTPADGNPVRVTDDEFYDLEPFLAQGDTSLTVTTSQPSNDDILFLSIVQVDALARVTTEVCGDGQDGDADGLPDANDPDCPGFVPIPVVIPVIPVVVTPVGTGICGTGNNPPCPVPVAPPVAVPLGPGPGATPPEATVARPKVVQRHAASPSGPAPRTIPRTGVDAGLLLSTALVLLFSGLALLRSGGQRRNRPS